MTSNNMMDGILVWYEDIFIDSVSDDTRDVMIHNFKSILNIMHPDEIKDMYDYHVLPEGLTNN